jgi:hypothetical protein
MDNELLLNMEVVLTPDVYQLSTDDDGNFYGINYQQMMMVIFMIV